MRRWLCYLAANIMDEIDPDLERLGKANAVMFWYGSFEA